MAEDALKIEDVDNTYMNFNYLNYFQELYFRKLGSMEQFNKKRHYNKLSAG
jgi:hypothetical protein